MPTINVPGFPFLWRWSMDRVEENEGSGMTSCALLRMLVVVEGRLYMFAGGVCVCVR